MDSNEERVQKHVGVNSPDQRREVPTERTERGLRLSPGTIAIMRFSRSRLSPAFSIHSKSVTD